MADPFVAEIRMMPFNFAPIGWAFCDGQLLPISQNTALFSLIGTYYGGNGKSTFGLPNMQGSAPMSHGDGPGLSSRFAGETGGVESITLIMSEIPAHNHVVRTVNDSADTNISAGNAMARSAGASVYGTVGANVLLGSSALAPAGGGLPHNNMQPYLTLNFCIALQGIFPPHP